MSEGRAHALLVRIRFHEGRYHGRPDWPPAPARLFQALVAGVGRSGGVPEVAADGLRWLERLDPPWIGAPRARVGQAVTYYVPNNDLDAKGSPELVEKVRTPKQVEPRLFDPDTPLLYLWWLSEATRAEAPTEQLQELGRDLYQLGRGIDPAWAEVEWLTEAEANDKVSEYSGVWRRPGSGGGRRTERLACPVAGSLDSLERRFQATLERFERVDRKRILFRQPPKPRFREVAYDAPPGRTLFELRSTRDADRLVPVVQSGVVALVESIRDGVAEQLAQALPHQADDVERMLVGRVVEGQPRVPASQRIRLIPLPSIGSPHADRGVRRLLVEVPAGGPLQARDVLWALSGRVVPVTPTRTSTDREAQLVPAADPGMARHYGLSWGADWPGRHGARRWRSVTPVALPESAARRRLEPGRPQTDRKSGDERAGEERRAVRAVRGALRHAEVLATVAAIRVQREPFEHGGHAERAESFAAGTRFAKERLWHVEIEFEREVAGPLVIGDGRFLGLGLLAPASGVRRDPSAVALRIVGGWTEQSDPLEVAHALRRAVLARAGQGGRDLPPEITGHAAGGRHAAGHRHPVYVCDPTQGLLLLLPGAVTRRDDPTRDERRAMRFLARACEGFTDLRAGRSGRLTLAPVPGELGFGVGTVWESRTLYTVRRHPRAGDPALALARALQDECATLDLPPVEVEVTHVRSLPRLGLSGRARLSFGRPISGPLVLGKTCHKGGGWFGVVS